MKLILQILLSVLIPIAGRRAISEGPNYKTVPIISASAKGWTIKPGTVANGSSQPTTIVFNPKGEEFNIGETQYPDFIPATLWIVEVKELQARFLIIRIPPALSAAVEMPILYISEDDKPSLAGKISQRFEFKTSPDEEPGFDPKVRWDGEHRLRDLLFEDSDGDGIPELVEKDFYHTSGEVTYFRFSEQQTFVPLWKETWKLNTAGNGSWERVSRTKVKSAKR